ncbi:MAG: transglycosylase SLT domain-containing protein [Blastocatellia bacterium]|nr:transglycosylase SLT domain-containing protein [Blastocatellia bacterium]
MRLSVLLIAIISLGFITGEARAQELSTPANDETGANARTEPQRTPMMVVYETRATTGPKAATPSAGDSKAAPSKPGSENKKEIFKPTADGAKTDSTPAASKAPNPLVIPAAGSAPIKLDTSGNPAYDEIVMKAAARHGVDPNLIFAVMRQESGFNSRARSYKGASGLMQLMPATARRFGVTDIFDPAQNIEGGTRYMRFLLDMFNGDVELALAGYNAGEGAVIKSGYRVPRYRETQNYVQVISARYGRTKHKANAAKSSEPVKPVAPDALQFSGGSSSRLSNNY